MRSVPSRSLALGAASLFACFLGCANLLGIEDWKDPALPGSTSSSGSGGSGVGGASASSSSGTSDILPTGDPTCADGVKNGPETDVDCGGDSCPPCEIGQACQNSADCKVGLCTDGLCAHGSEGCPTVDPENPTCGDCAKNGSETGIDCGGDVCFPCSLGQACITDADCATQACIEGACGPERTNPCEMIDPDNPSCGDCTQNGVETDVDCGGDCLPCRTGKACSGDWDCVSSSCVGGFCQEGTKGEPCLGASDCANASCAIGACWTGYCCN